MMIGLKDVFLISICGEKENKNIILIIDINLKTI